LLWYDAIPTIPDERLVKLMSAYDERVRGQDVLRQFLGLLSDRNEGTLQA
jgi:hypothetical protein